MSEGSAAVETSRIKTLVLLLERIVQAGALADDLKLSKIGINLDQARLGALKELVMTGSVDRSALPALRGSHIAALRDHLDLPRDVVAHAFGTDEAGLAQIERADEPLSLAQELAIEALLLRRFSQTELGTELVVRVVH